VAAAPQPRLDPAFGPAAPRPQAQVRVEDGGGMGLDIPTFLRRQSN
jgi:hypothetical protein